MGTGWTPPYSSWATMGGVALRSPGGDQKVEMVCVSISRRSDESTEHAIIRTSLRVTIITFIPTFSIRSGHKQAHRP